MLQQNRAEKDGGRGRGKKIVSGTVDNEEIPQEEQQRGPLQQFYKFSESLNDESSDEEGNYCTTCKICKIPWIELMK